MKTLVQFIQEKLTIKKIKHNYFPETKEELKDIIKQRIKQGGNAVNLNDINVSNIIDMSHLFEDTDFKGNISNWDVSNVEDMQFMFRGCKSFNCNISNWDVSSVTNMYQMFCGCVKFNQDISKWDVSKVYNTINIFENCPIEEKYKPKFR